MTYLAMLHWVVFASVIGTYIAALGVEGASLDDVLGAALVGLVFRLLDYVVVFDVTHLARDDPSKHPNQDRVTGVLVGPFIDDGVRFRAEPLPTCGREPILRMDVDNHATASVSLARLLFLPIAFKVFGVTPWSYQDIVQFPFYSIVHRGLRCCGFLLS